MAIRALVLVATMSLAGLTGLSELRLDRFDPVQFLDSALADVGDDAIAASSQVEFLAGRSFDRLSRIGEAVDVSAHEFPTSIADVRREFQNQPLTYSLMAFAGLLSVAMALWLSCSPGIRR